MNVVVRAFLTGMILCLHFCEVGMLLWVIPMQSVVGRRGAFMGTGRSADHESQSSGPRDRSGKRYGVDP